MFGSYYYFFVLLLPVFNYLLDKLGDVYILEVLETTALLLSIFMLVVAVLMNFAGINITQVSKQRENNIQPGCPDPCADDANDISISEHESDWKGT